MKNISILGSTGSIGMQALDVIRLNPEQFKVVGLAEGHDINLLASQIEEFKPEMVSVRDKDSADKLESLIPKDKTKILYGIEGACEVAALESAEMVLSAIVGAIGLLPTMKAIKARKQIALANKETLVAGGAVVTKHAKENNVEFLPVDSEHSAIFQSLQGHRYVDIEKLILTASGGPFRTRNIEEMSKIQPEDALKHPNWDMGAKITIDSATLMNKGLEVIEARWLFDVQPEKIEVVVHPQSIIHSLVQFKDGSIIGQLGEPEMKVPIAYALGYPERINSGVSPRSLADIANLTFEKPDFKKFPSLGLAFTALKAGESMPAVMNAANEIAVSAFLSKQIGFTQIPELVEKVMNNHDARNLNSIDDVIECDKFGRAKAKEILGEL